MAQNLRILDCPGPCLPSPSYCNGICSGEHVVPDILRLRISEYEILSSRPGHARAIADSDILRLRISEYEIALGHVCRHLRIVMVCSGENVVPDILRLRISEYEVLSCRPGHACLHVLGRSGYCHWSDCATLARQKERPARFRDGTREALRDPAIVQTTSPSVMESYTARLRSNTAHCHRVGRLCCEQAECPRACVPS